MSFVRSPATIVLLPMAALMCVLMNGCRNDGDVEANLGPGRMNGVTIEKKEDPPLVFGFALPFGANVGAERAHTVATYFSKILGRRVEPRLFDYDRLGDAMGSGSIDFAFMPPIAYVKAAQQTPVTLIRQAEHNGALSYRSVLFVRADSSIKSIADAQHKRVAWVEAGSASGRIFPMYALLSQGIDPAAYFSEQLSLPDHARVCKAVYEGKAEVGASFTNANTIDGKVDGCYRALEEKVSELRIITLGASIPNDVVVARANEPAALVETLAKELDRMMGISGGEAVLRDGFQSEGFFSVSDDAFDTVRQVLGVPIPFRRQNAAPDAPAAQFGSVPFVPGQTQPAVAAVNPSNTIQATPPVQGSVGLAPAPTVAPASPTAIAANPVPAPVAPANAVVATVPGDAGTPQQNRRAHRHSTRETDTPEVFRIGG